MELEAIPVFVKVAQLGSFTQAAKSLGMPNTTVSAKVAALERYLGVTLIQRTTRKLHLTDAGRAYLEHCVRALDELQTAESELQSNTQEIRGTLRVTAAVEVGQSLLAVIVDQYLNLYPKMNVELLVTNRMVDLVGEGVDLALRVGRLKDSSLISKRFIDANFTLWASKSYLKKNGTPKDVKDASNHRFIRFSNFPQGFEFTNGKQTLKLATTGPVQVDDFGTMKTLAELGHGIAMLPDFLCKFQKDHQLVRILPEWSGPAPAFALVYPAQKFVTPKLRAFISVADEFLKTC